MGTGIQGDGSASIAARICSMSGTSSSAVGADERKELGVTGRFSGVEGGAAEGYMCASDGID